MGCGTFSHISYGKTFELVTDHKPLEVIFSPKSKPCAGIERWVLRLQCYSYNVIYRAGKSNIADPLSRLCVQTTQKSFDEDCTQRIVEESLPRAVRLEEIIEYSGVDEEIQKVKLGVYENNWLPEVSMYKIFNTELCVSGEVFLRGTRIVVPK